MLEKKVEKWVLQIINMIEDLNLEEENLLKQEKKKI